MYKVIVEDVLNAYILDEKESRIVALCTTKRPDLGFEKLEELVKQANMVEKYKIEIEQHISQNPVFHDGGRNEDVYVLQEKIINLQAENAMYKKR